ncbi:MAG: DUF58 domain-containing protein [Bacillota bacterium]
MTPGQMMAVGLTVIGVGLAAGNPAVVIPGMLLCMVAGVSWLWANHLLSSVSCEASLSSRRARPGDRVDGQLVISNDQPFPIPWLDCRLEWPSELGVGRGTLVRHHNANRSIYRNVLSLRWFEKVVRRFQVSCDRRGEFIFGPLELRAADPFGLFEGKRSFELARHLLVYPRVVPVAVTHHARLSPFGEKPSPSWVLDDPAYFRGTRDYSPGDPFYRIEWKATARTGRLHTKLQDAPFATEVAVVLNVSTGEYCWEGVQADLVERTLVVAASVVQMLCKAGYRVGVCTNGFVRGAHGPAAVKVGAGPAHFGSCMQLLARVLLMPGTRFEPVLAAACRRLGTHTQVLVITGILTPGLVREAERHRAAGQKISVLYTGTGRPGSTKVPLYQVREEGNWDELAQITLYQT